MIEACYFVMKDKNEQTHYRTTPMDPNLNPPPTSDPEKVAMPKVIHDP